MVIKQNTKYSVAIIGCGDIGYFFDDKRDGDGALSHYKAFSQSSHFEVVAVAEPKPERRDILSKEAGVLIFADHIQMLKQIKADVVVVATPDATHEPILGDLLKYKPRLVFSEKPLTLRRAATDNVITQYEREGIGLQVNFTRRFTGAFRDIKDLLTDNALGDIQSVTAYYSRGLCHNGSTLLDVFLWYWGDPMDIVVEGEQEGMPDDPTVSALLTYPNGMRARLVGLPASMISFNEIDIIGSQGRARVTYDYQLEIFDMKHNDMYPGYFVYHLKDQRKVDYTKSLPLAVDNIRGWLDRQEPLISPGKNSRDIDQLIDRVKEKTSCRI